MTWKSVLIRFVDDAESYFDTLKYRLAYKLGGPGPIKIITYLSYGTQERLHLIGRVLEDRQIASPDDNDTIWQNLVGMYRRIASNEVPHARLRLQFQGVSQEITADVEGYFDTWIEPARPLPADQLWHEIDLELLEPLSDRQGEPVRATARVFVPPPAAHFGVISDIDDTIVITDATNILRMARTVFLGNARTRLPFPGIAAFYRALHAGPEGYPTNPLLYVSSSPWNLYDLLSEFFELNDIPTGIIYLRDWGINEHEIIVPREHHRHKLGLIREMLDTYQDLPFILIGDSGQEDPEIYRQVVDDYPNRILAVYIRNVSRDLKRPAAIHALAEEVLKAGSTLILADNTLAMAEHAAEQGWIAPEALADIRAEKAKDEAPPDLLEAIVGVEEAGDAPTIVVEPESAE